MDLVELLDMATAIAPEIRDDLHIVEHQPQWPAMPAGVRAYASRCLPHIGAGLSCIVFGPGDWSRSEALSITCHELAHLLPHTPPVTLSPPAVELRELLLHRWSAAPAVDPALPPWQGHGAEWIRTALHLLYRAQRLGYPVRLPYAAVAGEQYGLSDVSNYHRWLGWEPEQYITSTFAAILAKPAPPAFTYLFQQDTHHANHR